jgi:2-polyprenyl-6-methoxyphenol hydroxylase-like FAD-dependent oxidoreductase
MKYLLLAFLFLTGASFAAPSVLVIGGGPSGLATAIVAKMQGCRTTLIEKREAHTRTQRLFLFEPTLKLLEKWKVDLSLMHIMDLGNGERIGFVCIHDLEQALEKRAKELGVRTICGVFLQGLAPQHKALILADQKMEIPYDILVGADGAHSPVREAAGIKAEQLGTGSGAFAFVPLAVSDAIDVTPPIPIENGFLRRIKIPFRSIVFIQTHKPATKTCLEKAIASQGWAEEIAAFQENKATIAWEIGVLLQRASSFYDKKSSVILVGDAAATASFFQGMGANTALRTAEIAGAFFRKRDATIFHQSMKEATDALIQDSAFLFSDQVTIK